MIFLSVKTYKFVDLFAGIGGFHAAFSNVAKKNDFTIKCVLVSEIDKEAKLTYSNNFNYDVEKIVNIRDLADDSSDVLKHDILFGGFPCQAFSGAGKKLGFLDETRGTLFFDIANILKNKQPKYFLLENVKHLINHDYGRTWEIINSTLRKIGYAIPKKPLVLSPTQFGIPQERERVYIPGVLKHGKYANLDSIELDFSDILIDKNLNSDANALAIIKSNYLEKKVDSKYYIKNQANGSYLLKVLDAWDDFLKNVKKPVGRTLPVIWADEFKGTYSLDGLVQWRQKYIKDMRNIYKNNKTFIDQWLIKHDVKSWKKREKKFEWQAGVDNTDIKNSFIQLRQSGIRCRKRTRFPTLVAMVQVPILFDESINEWRQLTPRENANLQSFPKTFKTNSEISDSNNDFYSYKQFGNSINVKVISEIIERLMTKYK